MWELGRHGESDTAGSGPPSLNAEASAFGSFQGRKNGESIIVAEVAIIGHESIGCNVGKIARQLMSDKLSTASLCLLLWSRVIKIPISDRVQAPEQFCRTWPELFLGLGRTTKSALIKILRLFEVHRDFGIPSRINTDVIYTTSVHTI
ncbi:hypothetical protein WN944_016977 [Citrus x changshan-huyou]|uniref:Uncharacterized protein n=1 Tax=Citrus x changshan-huyou TaxID=2935761 RepID=A0AAP0QP47_9ROSI